MKKALAIIFSLALLLALAACGASGPKTDLADGVYTAQIDALSAQREGNGWADTLTLTVSKGVITEAVFDSFNADGQKKSEVPTDQYPMNPAPAEWLPQLAKNLLAASGPDEVEAVAGATSSSGTIRLLYAAILERGVAGETIFVKIDMADGVYTAQMAEASHGWTDYLVLTYNDGTIVSVEFNSLDADGNKKSEADAETYPMEPHPSAWLPQLAEQIQNAPTPDDIAGIAGATNSSANARLLYMAILTGGTPGATLTVNTDGTLA